MHPPMMMTEDLWALLPLPPNFAIDLLAEEVENLGVMTKFDCDPCYHSFGLTPFSVKNSSLEMQRLATFVKGRWNNEFLKLSLGLTQGIASLSSTHINALNLDSSSVGKIWKNVKKLSDPAWIYLCPN